MKCSACLIHNPVAGQGDPAADLQRIRELLEPVIDLDIRLTTAEIGADQLAQEAVAEGVSMIIASGGDGTLSAAAAALAETKIPLGIISRGTANALANTLGIPNTLEAACQTILDGYTRVIDTAKCNDRHMVLLTGIGFEAETIERADRATKNRWGRLAYVLAGMQQLRQMRAFQARIETEDQMVTVNAVAVTVANAAPPTSILAQGPAKVVFDDGMLDVTIVALSKKTGMIAAVVHLLQTVLRGIKSKRPDIDYLRVHTIKVTTEPSQKVVVDGEPMGTTPVEIQCLPRSLNLIVPKLVSGSLTNNFQVSDHKA